MDAKSAACHPCRRRVLLPNQRSTVAGTENQDRIPSQYHGELPGAPDGDFVVFQFHTRFEHKREAVETVTPMPDTDGRWRVSGYFIR